MILPVSILNREMIGAFREEINKSLEDKQENTIKQVKEINQTVQDLNVEIETIKKTNWGNPGEEKHEGEESQLTDPENIFNKKKISLT